MGPINYQIWSNRCLENLDLWSRIGFEDKSCYEFKQHKFNKTKTICVELVGGCLKFISWWYKDFYKALHNIYFNNKYNKGE